MEERKSRTAEFFFRRNEVTRWSGYDWCLMWLEFSATGKVRMNITCDEPLHGSAARSFRDLVTYYYQNPGEIDELFGLVEDTVLTPGEEGRTWGKRKRKRS